MKFQGEDAAHTTFVRLARPHAADAAAPGGSVVISRAALHLHTFGVLSSIEAGHDGFVSDGYLDAIAAETSISALELCLLGLWDRSEGGYRVADGDVRQVRGRIRGQLLDLASRCRRDGGHRVDRDHPGLCARCGAPAPGASPVV